MSKYIKLEDAEKLLTNALRIAQGFDEPLERSLVDLPTIEVSEEDLYIPLNNQTVKRINRLHKDECGEYFDEEWLFNELEQISELREVSEEQLSKLQASEKSVENTTASEDFTSISRANSKLEVSEDAISREWLRNMFGLSEKTRKWGGDHSGYNTMMLYEIQDYIEDAPSVVPQVPNEDCISRHYMLRALNGYGKDWQEDCEIADVIRNAPSVIPQEKEGEWIEDEYCIPHCSECNCINNTIYTNYCPNCGAKMKGADDE